MPTFTANEMIDEAVFEKEWQHFKDVFGGSEEDMIHGYMINKAIGAIVAKAFNIENVDVSVEEDENNAIS